MTKYWISHQKKTGLTPREIFLKYIRFLPWLVISLAIMLLLAYVKLRYSTPIYNVTAKLLVKKTIRMPDAEKNLMTSS